MRYAVKIGEVYIRSEEPITLERQKEILRQLLKDPAGTIATGCAVVVVTATGQAKR
jgi:hypothetical protein